VVIILACLAEILEPWMIPSLFYSDGPDFLSHKSGQPFMKTHPQCADALRPKADRGGEHQRRAVGFEQVGRAHIRLKTIGNQGGDIHQRLNGLAGFPCEISDILEGQHITCAAFTCGGAHLSSPF
jgi:hypothetical protein